ncbi:MAG: 16S rRNA (guanine(527)-N(7))-methyltransferase RsmG [Azonexus sp.]|jgi:16S rRNA (guanine527-N7)-methyltransferase|nr:16S rRNA (guanine(527)-N(7))-methyltransferase RsmG [Azonexus sp.]
MSANFSSDLANDLASGLAALGLELPPGAERQLLAFRDLLLKWNKTYNLTAVRDPDAAIASHLLDSLAILPSLATGSLLDVGSGGGLPGIPLAIARPGLPVTLVDAVQKKTDFLRQAAIELGLSNVNVRHARVEDMTGQYAQITARALTSLKQFVDLTRHLLAPGGRWLAMKGVRPADEIAALPDDITVDAVLPLAIPGLDAERHLLILKKRP